MPVAIRNPSLSDLGLHIIHIFPNQYVPEPIVIETGWLEKLAVKLGLAHQRPNPIYAGKIDRTVRGFIRVDNSDTDLVKLVLEWEQQNLETKHTVYCEVLLVGVTDFKSRIVEFRADDSFAIGAEGPAGCEGPDGIDFKSLRGSSGPAGDAHFVSGDIHNI